MTDEQNDTIDIDGRRYAFRSIGSGPPLVLLNGYSATAQDWDPTLLAGLAASFEVICPDHRGMGESELGDPAELTIDSMAADVERLLSAKGIERAPVAGWSMGGFIAQRLAVRSPQRVEALVLMGTDAGGPAAVRATPETWAQLTDHSGTPREQASRLIPLLFPPALVSAIDEAFGDLIAQARAGLSLDAVVAQERAMTAWHAEEQPPMNADAAAPVLVLVGTEDVVIPPENGELLAARWSPCEIERFVGSGHAFFALEPQRTADRITLFLQG
ncbi:MAG: alpha/beta fold hydrolase [Acidimicrobiia bacterium]